MSFAARAALAAAVLGGGVQSQEPTSRPAAPASRPSARENAVLEVLRRRLPVADAAALRHVVFERARPSEPYLPRFAPGCGLGVGAPLDAARARETVVALGAAYDVRLTTTDGARDAGPSTVALVDAAGRIGFVIRAARGSALRDPATRAAEPDAAAASLRRAGRRVFVADLDAFEGPIGGAFVPELAFAASVVAFLDDACGPPVVDVSALLGPFEATFATPAFDVARTILAPAGPDARPATINSPTTLRWDVDAAARAHATTSPRRVDRSAPGGPRRRRTGSPTWIAVPLWPTVAPDGVSALPEPEIVLRQATDGGAPVVAAGRGGVFLAPSTFDAARPFVLEAKVAAGTWTVGGEIRVGVAAAQ